MRVRPVRLLSAVFVALALGVGTAAAQEHETFTPERFAALQAEGAIILLDVYADWCPTCAQQQKILADYRERHPEARSLSPHRFRQPEAVRDAVPGAAAVHAHHLPRR
jgi:thioredoxin 1